MSCVITSVSLDGSGDAERTSMRLATGRASVGVPQLHQTQTPPPRKSPLVPGDAIALAKAVAHAVQCSFRLELSRRYTEFVPANERLLMVQTNALPIVVHDWLAAVSSGRPVEFLTLLIGMHIDSPPLVTIHSVQGIASWVINRNTALLESMIYRQWFAGELPTDQLVFAFVYEWVINEILSATCSV